MNNKQENRFSMYVVLRDFLLAQQDAVSTLPDFVPLFSAFKACLLDIQLQRNVQEGDKSGVTDEKHRLKEHLILQAIDLRHKLVAFAKISNNLPLLKEVEYSESAFRKASDSVLGVRVKLLLQHALTHQSDAAPYGITKEVLEAIERSLHVFEAAVTRPRLSLNQRKGASEKIALAFQQAETAIDKMDALINLLQFSNPDLFNGYTRARKVIATGSKATLALKADVRDGSGQPLANVIFEILPGDAVAKPVGGDGAHAVPLLVKKTSSKGNLNISDLAEGAYTAHVKRVGYVSQSVVFYVVNREIARVNVVLNQAV